MREDGKKKEFATVLVSGWLIGVFLLSILSYPFPALAENKTFEVEHKKDSLFLERRSLNICEFFDDFNGSALNGTWNNTYPNSTVYVNNSYVGVDSYGDFNPDGNYGPLLITPVPVASSNFYSEIKIHAISEIDGGGQIALMLYDLNMSRVGFITWQDSETLYARTWVAGVLGNTVIYNTGKTTAYNNFNGTLNISRVNGTYHYYIDGVEMTEPIASIPSGYSDVSIGYIGIALYRHNNMPPLSVFEVDWVKWHVSGIYTPTNPETNTSSQNETNSNNDTYMSLVADLYIVPETVSLGSALRVGMGSYIAFSVGDRGTAPSTGNISVSTLDGNTIYTSSRTIYPGEEISVVAPWTPSVVGNVTLVIKIECPDEDLATLGDNVVYMNATVYSDEMKFADFAVFPDWIRFSPQNPTIGSIVNVYVNISNIGDIDGTFAVDAYVDDTPLEPVSIDLSAGQVKSLNYKFLATDTHHNFTVVLDPENLVPELNETNNIATISIEVGHSHPNNQHNNQAPVPVVAIVKAGDFKDRDTCRVKITLEIASDIVINTMITTPDTTILNETVLNEKNTDFTYRDGALYMLRLHTWSSTVVNSTIQFSIGDYDLWIISSLSPDMDTLEINLTNLFNMNPLVENGYYMDALNSYDVDGTITNYRWTIDSENVFNGASIAYHFNTTGIHNITLELTDDSGATTTWTYKLTVSSGTGLPTNAGKPQKSSTTTMVVVGGVAAAAVISVVAVSLLTEVGKVALLSLLFPLYTRLKREKITEHYTRGRIYQYVKDNPGAYYSQIRDDLKLNNGSVAYHLRVLEREELIKSSVVGTKRQYYPCGMKVDEKTMKKNSFNPTQKSIMEYIEENPGATQAEISNGIGISQQVVSYNLNKLEDEGFVLKDREDGKNTYYAVAEDEEF